MAKRLKTGTSLFLALLITLFSATFFVLPQEAAVSQNGWSVSKEDVHLNQLVSLPRDAASATGSYDSLRLYPGGMPFGVKFLTEGLLIVSLHDFPKSDGIPNPAREAGLQPNDMLLQINGSPIGSVEDLHQRVEEGKGAPLTVLYTRNGSRHTATVTPLYAKSEGRFVTGMSVRDSGAGIGTVTFIFPESGAFGGLGHGICDGNTGKLIPMQRGSVVGVTISGVTKGLSGSPGEVRGYFSSGKIGSLIGNTECGVYGVLAKLPEKLPCEPMPVGLRGELKEGKAYIYCALDGPTNARYEIEISNIQRDSTSNKCFTVKITDPALLEKTGGIIQGMSGSPIIQNGKLVGAVTHVLINDPTTGYGIFVENMLNAANMPMAKAS